MQITVQKKALEKMLNASTQSVNPKSPINAIQGVLLTAKGDTIKMTGTDLDITITSIGEAEVIDEGDVLIPAKRLSDLVKNLPDGSINMESKEESVEIHYGKKQKSTIKTFPVEEFPATEQPDSLISAKFNTGEFLSAVSKVYFAAADEESRPVLMGVLFNFTPFGLDIIATDTHRLNIISTPSETDEKQVVVPKRTIEKIIRLCKDEEITVSVGESIVQFAAGNVIISTRQIAGKFPPHNTIIPKEFSTECEIDTKEILGSLNRAVFMVPLTKQIPVVNLSIADNTFTVNAQDDNSELNESYDCNQTGDELNISFSTKYLHDLLSVINSNKVTLKFNGNLCYVQHDNFCSVVVAVVPVSAVKESA